MAKRDRKKEGTEEQMGKEPAAGYVYMLRCKDGSLYTGITTQPLRRWEEHKAAGEAAAKYTRSHPVSHVERLFEAEDLRAAARYEYRIKRLDKRSKEALVKDPARMKHLFPALFSESPVREVRDLFF